MDFRQTANNLIVCLLIVVVSAVAMFWTVAPDVFSANWYVRIGSIVGCLGAVVGVAILLASRRNHEQQLLFRCVDAICQNENVVGSEQHSLQAITALGENHSWKPILSRLNDCVHSYRERIANAEHGRSSAQVRVRQLTNKCEQMWQIVSGLADPVLAIDHFDELVLANPSAEKMLEFDAESTEKRALDSLLVCEELVELLLDTRRRTMPAQRTGEVALSSGDGETRHYRVTCTGIATATEAVDSDESAPHGAVAVFNDITNEKAIQKRNAEFVSSVSHEMKTPLSSIKAYVELLADGDAEDEETQEEFLGVINSQADRLQRLIDNLLNLARIEAGVVEVNKESRSLNELLDEAFDVVQPSAESKQIKLRKDLSPMYLGVLADRDMLLQSAINLLSNAIKYTPAGGAVTLRSRMQDSDVTFEVQDTGVGLNEDDRQNVFKKFYRVKKDRQMAAGTGLGLPLAKHIVEDVHGGQMTVQSELGQGSIFRVTLPSASRRI